MDIDKAFIAAKIYIQKWIRSFEFAIFNMIRLKNKQYYLKAQLALADNRETPRIVH